MLFKNNMNKNSWKKSEKLGKQTAIEDQILQNQAEQEEIQNKYKSNL